MYVYIYILNHELHNVKKGRNNKIGLNAFDSKKAPFKAIATARIFVQTKLFPYRLLQNYDRSIRKCYCLTQFLHFLFSSSSSSSLFF